MSLILSLVKAINRQLWMVVNFFLTVVGIFVFGYYAAYFAGFSSTGVRKITTRSYDISQICWISFSPNYSVLEWD